MSDWAGDFGNRVRELREARGWSQEQLGRKMGKSASTVRNIEAAGVGYEPYPTTMLSVARAFGKDGPDLLRSVGRVDMAAQLENEGGDDALAGLSDAERQRVFRVAREIIEMGRDLAGRAD